MKYVCELCGYVYDELAGNLRSGIVPGTAFSDLPQDFECPGCGYEKEAFNPLRTDKTGMLWTQSRYKGTLRR